MKRRNKILISVPLLILILVFGLYLWLFHYGLAEKIAIRILNDQVGRNLGIRFHIEKISGDYFAAPIIKSIDVIYENGAESYTMAHVSRLTAEYSLKKLWRGEFIFNKIVVKTFHIDLPAGQLANQVIDLFT